MFSCGPLVDCASRPRPPQTLKNETPPGCPSPGGLPLECAHLGIVEEEDPHEALRAYARLYLGAPPLASDDVLEAAGPISTADDRAAKESEIPNFKGSDLGRFPLVSAEFWTSDHLSERPRSVDAFSGTRARGTLTLKRR